jgi:hypothetical protein
MNLTRPGIPFSWINLSNHVLQCNAGIELDIGVDKAGKETTFSYLVFKKKKKKKVCASSSSSVCSKGYHRAFSFLM